MKRLWLVLGVLGLGVGFAWAQSTSPGGGSSSGATISLTPPNKLCLDGTTCNYAIYSDGGTNVIIKDNAKNWLIVDAGDNGVINGQLSVVTNTQPAVLISVPVNSYALSIPDQTAMCFNGVGCSYSIKATSAGFNMTSILNLTSATDNGVVASSGSGYYALKDSNNGSRIGMGAGATSTNYITGDGTNLTTPGPFQSASLMTADYLKSVAGHDAGTAIQAIERGSGTMTASALAVTFDTAFAVAPHCVCSHVSGTPIGCGPAAAPSTTAVTFNVPAGTGVLDWICIGDK